MKDIKGYEGLYAITSCGRVWHVIHGLQETTHGLHFEEVI